MIVRLRLHVLFDMASDGSKDAESRPAYWLNFGCLFLLLARSDARLPANGHDRVTVSSCEKVPPRAEGRKGG
jgi:hypothetical protein